MTDYYQIDAMNASAIKRGAISMQHMQHYYSHPPKPSATMRAGSLRHMALLEPQRFGALHEWDGSRNTNAYRAFSDEVGADNIITLSELRQHLDALSQLQHHEAAQRYLSLPGQCEAEYYLEHDGHACKAKVDKMCDDGTMIEFKTTGSLDRFESTAAQMHYHLQLGWYWHATQAKRVVVIAQEIAAPYSVAVMTVRKINVRLWYQDALAIAERWWSGDRSGPYPDEFAFELPGWYQGGTSADSLSLDDQLDW